MDTGRRRTEFAVFISLGQSQILRSIEFCFRQQETVHHLSVWHIMPTKFIYCYILIIGLIMMRAVKMALNVGHQSQILRYVNGLVEKEFDYFPFLCFAHQENRRNRLLRKLTLFSLNLSEFEFHFTAEHCLDFEISFPFFPLLELLITSQSVKIHRQKLARRYGLM